MNSRTGKWQTNLQYFLTDLGEHKVILGYPWFATAQPKIDWARGWIDHSQLPIVLRSHNAVKAQFQAQTTRVLSMRICQGEVIPLKKRVPVQYH